MKDTLDADVAAFLDGYVRHERRLAENTRLTYVRGLSRFTSFVRDGGVADYLAPCPAEIADYVEALHAAGLAPATRSIAIVALRLFFKRLVDLGRLSAAAARPVEALAAPAVPERLPRVLTVEEVRRLLDAPRQTSPLFLRCRALAECLYAAALRASEACDLRLDNLDLGAATARVQGKGGKTRVVLLGEPAVQALRTYLSLLRPDLVERADEPQPWVFLSRSGQRLTREMIWLLVKSWAVTAGLPDWVGAHSLRHAAGTHLLQGGADLRYVMEYLGHANVQTTTIYLHLDLSDLRQAHERFLAYRQFDNDAGIASPELPAVGLPLLNGLAPDWSAEEDEWVRTLSIDEVIQRTGRTRGAVQWRRRILGIRNPPSSPRWTAEEEDLVRTLSIAEAAARLPGRTRDAIKIRRRELGVCSDGAAPWTVQENELLRTLTLSEAADRLPHRTYTAIRRRRRELGLPDETFRPWTEEEDKLLRTLSFHEAARQTRRTYRAVKLRRLELGLQPEVRPQKQKAMRPWTPEEDNLLRTLPFHVAARRMRRPLRVAKLRCLELGIGPPERPKKEPKKVRPWLSAEDEIVLALPLHEAVERLPGRSRYNVMCRRKALGIAKQAINARWTAEEEELLRALPPREAAQRTGHSLGAVLQHRRKLGIFAFRLWTATEDELAHTLLAEEVAERTGRTLEAVRLRQGVLRRRSGTKTVD